MQITDNDIIITLIVSASHRRSDSLLRQIRINQEGIFCGLPVFETLITWDEIAVIAPYTLKFLGHYPVLGIIPRDYKALITRTIEEHAKNAWLRTWYHLLDNINTYFLHRSNALAYINIYQYKLPISIDEFITVIYERFAVELREHQVTVLDWQN